MTRCFQITTVLVCCAILSASAQEEEISSPRPGYAVEALPGVEQQIELSVPADNAQAEPIDPQPDATEPEADAAATSYQGTRDPFWPVNYVPPVERKATSSAVTNVSAARVEEAPITPQWDLALKTVTIKGVMKAGSGYMAIINGQVTGENDTVSVDFRGRTYSWRIAKIGKEGVRFERLDRP